MRFIKTTYFSDNFYREDNPDSYREKEKSDRKEAFYKAFPSLLVKLVKEPTTLTVLCFFVIIHFSQAQQLSLGLSGSIGLSKVTTELPITDDYDASFTTSANLGVFLEKQLNQHFFLGMEILWTQIEGYEASRDRVLLTWLEEQNRIQAIGIVEIDETKLHASYLGVPVYLGFQMKKFELRAGVRPMIFLFANADHETNGIFFEDPFHATSRDENIQFNRIDVGSTLGIGYQLLPKLRIQADAYYGLKDITIDGTWERNIRQVTLGVNYGLR